MKFLFCLVFLVAVSCKSNDKPADPVEPTPTPVVELPTPTPAPVVAPIPVVGGTWQIGPGMICPSPMPPPQDLSGQSCSVLGSVRGCNASTFYCK